MSGWRRFLLRLFGARIGRGAVVRPSCRIWHPWNLSMESLACLADNVNCNCAAPIAMGYKSTVSQNSILSSASYDADSAELAPIVRPIRIEDHAWVASNVFVGPGVRIGEGAVVGACSVVLADVEPWNIVGGNPLRFIKKRVLREVDSDRPEAASPSF